MVSLPTGALGLSPAQGLQEKELHRPGPLGGVSGAVSPGLLPPQRLWTPGTSERRHCAPAVGAGGHCEQSHPQIKKTLLLFLKWKGKVFIIF